MFRINSNAPPYSLDLPNLKILHPNSVVLRQHTHSLSSQTLTLESGSVSPMAYQTPNHDSPSDSNTQKRLYNPYKDLEVPIRNLYQLPTSPEHLFVEEAARKHRSWGETLTFLTGCGYLGGAVAGAGVGLVEGVKSFESGDTMKLRVNRILNSSGHTGRTWGNRLGVIGLLYAGIESGITAARDTDDVLNSIAAGLGTGVLYRAARGVRSAAVAGAVGGVVVGVAVTAKQALKRYVPI